LHQEPKANPQAGSGKQNVRKTTQIRGGDSKAGLGYPRRLTQDVPRITETQLPAEHTP
jgi:hypothetical protein